MTGSKQSRVAPQVLIDQPEDGYCEERGWVEATIGEDEARELLSEFCCDENGNPGRLIGGAERVTLRLTNPAADYEDQRWLVCRPTAKTAVEFFEFDATAVETKA